MSAQPCGCDPDATPPYTTQACKDQGFCQSEPRINRSTALLPRPQHWLNEVRPAILPTDAKARKDCPIASGVLDYFPKALAAVARVSFAGNEQHNPGQPLHWDRTKSTDESDALIRHFFERGTVDSDGQRHSAKVAWRALALLEKELEQL